MNILLQATKEDVMALFLPTTTHSFADVTALCGAKEGNLFIFKGQVAWPPRVRQTHDIARRRCRRFEKLT